MNSVGHNYSRPVISPVTTRCGHSALSRLPGRYPGLVDKLMVMAMDTDMQRVVTRGVHTLEGLKHITFQKLITSVEEENSRQNFISGIERKEQQKQKERKDLETRLTAEKESRQKEVKRLTDQRDKLLGTLPAQRCYRWTS